MRATVNSYALHIALNRVDASLYGGNDGLLNISETDARAFLKIAHYEGYRHKVALFGAAATTARFKSEVAMAANALDAGDHFLLTFSGHGTQLAKSPTRYEVNNRDEALCFWDGTLVDDDIREALSAFKKGVKILVVADSCHSGDILREIFGKNGLWRGWKEGIRSVKPKSNSFGARTAECCEIRADIILLAAAHEDEIAYAGNEHSKFVEAILKVWNVKQFKGGHKAFVEALNALRAPRVQSVLNQLDCNDSQFLGARPFAIINHK